MDKDLENLHDMFPVDADIVYDAYIKANRNIDDTISALIAICKESKPFPPTYEEAISSVGGTSSNETFQPEIPKKRKDSRRNSSKKDWKPPILGRLSDDFLKVPSEILQKSATYGFKCKGCSKLKLREKTNSNETSNNTLNFPTSTEDYNMEDIDSIIRKRMEDNVSLTRSVTMRRHSNADDIQYLDDERLALMLQNQEFRSVVKADPQFQQALAEDNQDREEGEDSVDVWQMRNDSIDFRPQDFPMDYGYARSDIVDPDCVWPDRPNGVVNPDAKKIVKSLGKASRKRLGSIAKLFPNTRRSGSSKGYASIDSFAESHQPQARQCWDDESVRDLIISEPDNNSYIGPRDRSARRTMSVISEHSSNRIFM